MVATALEVKPTPQFPDMRSNYAKMITEEAAQAALSASKAAQALVEQRAVTYATPTVASVVTAPASSPSLSQWLLALRTCEAGGNYAENTGNGFYGAYQFTIATWNHWNTGYARADLAPASVQDATIVENTLGTAGLSTQNPGCYRSQGLSNYPPSN